MKVDNDALRGALDAEAARTGRASRGCPGTDLLERFSRHEESASERMAFAEHLLACPDCAAEYRLVRSLETVSADAAGEPSGGRPRSPVGYLRPHARFAWATAAAALVVVGLSAVWLASRPRGEDDVRERGAGEPAFSVAPAQGAALAEPPARLTWSPVDGAEEYRVTLFDAESTPLWESSALYRPEALLPAEIGARLRRGGSFYWRVQTRRRAERLSSPLYRFTVGSGPTRDRRP